MTQSPMRTESAEAYVAMQQDLVHISGYLLKLTRDGKWQRRCTRLRKPAPERFRSLTPSRQVV